MYNPNKKRWVHYRRSIYKNPECICGKETPDDMMTAKRFDAEHVTRNMELVTCNRCLVEIINKMKKGLEATNDLINESDGVAGLHLNGNIATWDELLNNEWMTDFNEACDLL